MLEVAFSRRMCCSRVASVRQKPRSPLESVVWPTRRPGMLRTNLSRVARKPTYGPPKLSGTPNDCPSPATMSASAGGRAGAGGGGGGKQDKKGGGGGGGRP